MELVSNIKILRSNGSSLKEIRSAFPTIPVSTINYWCKDIMLNKLALALIHQKKQCDLKKAREKALLTNKLKRQDLLNTLDQHNMTIVPLIENDLVAKVALATLCLGEASKYNSCTRSAFSLGNTNPKAIILFLELLKQCFVFDISKIRATIQCRADQNPDELKLYWHNITNIPLNNFYKAQVDKRTLHKPTRKPGYKGVLRIDYFNTKVQLELESLTNLIYNQLLKRRGEGR